MNEEDRKWPFERLDKMTISQIYDLVATLDTVIAETANELGCEADNEAILEAIYKLKNKKVKAEAVVKAFDNGYNAGYAAGKNAGELSTLTDIRDKVNMAIENAILDRGG